LPNPQKHCAVGAGVRSRRDIRRSLSVRIVPRTPDFDAKRFDKCAKFVTYYESNNMRHSMLFA